MDQEINCTVDSCKYHDRSDKCTLNSIEVGIDSPSQEAHEKKETECASFECND